MSLLEKKAQGRPDNFQTPSWPIELIYNFIRDNGRTGHEDPSIWDPCCGQGKVRDYFVSRDMICLASDIEIQCPDSNRLDFLTEEWSLSWDYIITNPPYSLKDKFINRCYSLGKPFALLLPVTALAGKRRMKMYKEYGMQVCMLPDRVNYHTPSGRGSGAHFDSVWITNGFNFEKDITYL